jgi:hypothetical protein
VRNATAAAARVARYLDLLDLLARRDLQDLGLLPVRAAERELVRHPRPAVTRKGPGKARGAESAMARCSARHAIVSHPPGGKSVGGWARAKRGIPGTRFIAARLLYDGDQAAGAGGELSSPVMFVC